MEQLTTEQLTSPRASALEQRAYSLLVLHDGETSTYSLPENGRVLIGRSKQAEIRIEHGSVSRDHAALHIGPELLLEDLGSVNGTRLRGVRLTAATPTPIAPDDVIDLGEVILVVKHRRLEQRLRHACSTAFFEVRVEEECERAASGAARFAVAQVVVDGELSVQAAEALLTSELRQRDLIATREPGRYELLLLDAGPDEAYERIGRAVAVLRERKLRVQTQLFCAPRDGTSSSSILGRKLELSPPSSVHKSPPGFIVEDEAMRRVRRLLERIALSDLSVILLGETGVGKEMCAELVHACSARDGQTFLRFNCAALTETLLESELFGHERGSFTGATGDKIGLLESASGGSVFLDEVGDMPLSTQVKLLRVLESKEILRLGSRVPRRIDVRVISATNQDLEERITQGLFREDLFYRLNGISVVVPPLRERPRDIEPLARHFVARKQPERSGRAPVRLNEASISWLREQSWPGNVRELRNVIERALVLCDGPVIEPGHLSLAPGSLAKQRRSDPAHHGVAERGLRDEVKDLERGRIEQALRDSDGNQRRAADKLGISRGALLRRLELLGIARPRKGG